MVLAVALAASVLLVSVAPEISSFSLAALVAPMLLTSVRTTPLVSAVVALEKAASYWSRRRPASALRFADMGLRR